MNWLPVATLIVGAFTVALFALNVVIAIHRRRARRGEDEP